jgi:hypothetical protein
MSLETKRLVAYPYSETAAIDGMRAFGWELKSRNEVLNSVEHYDGSDYFSYNGVGGGTVYTHTEVTHFVSLLFERDNTMPHYAELTEHEKAYNQALEDLSQYDDQCAPALSKLQEKKNLNATIRQEQRRWKRSLYVGVVFIVLYFLLSIILAAAFKAVWYFGACVMLLFIGLVLTLDGAIKKTQAEGGFAKTKQADAALDKQIAAYAPKRKTINDRVVAELEAGRQLVDENKKLALAAPAAKALPKSEDSKTKLAKLKDLHEEGLITDDEFEAKKQEILSDL